MKVEITVGTETVINVNSVLNVDALSEVDYILAIVDNNAIKFADSEDDCSDRSLDGDPHSIWAGKLFDQDIISVGFTFFSDNIDGSADGLNPDFDINTLPIDGDTGLDLPNGGGSIHLGNSTTLDISDLAITFTTSFDSDSDGVSDDDDLCEGTTNGAVVDTDGCSITQNCSCDDFSNNGQVVSCTVRVAQDFLQNGLITRRQVSDIIRASATNICSKEN